MREVGPKLSLCWAKWWEASSPLLFTSIIPVQFPPSLWDNLLKICFKVLHYSPPSVQQLHGLKNLFIDHAALSVPTPHMKHTARSPHPELLEASEKLFSSLSSSLGWKVRVHCENRYYFKQPVRHVVRMAHEPHQATLKLLFYGLELQVLMHPWKATGRNHTKRLKMW